MVLLAGKVAVACAEMTFVAVMTGPKLRKPAMAALAMQTEVAALFVAAVTAAEAFEAAATYVAAASVALAADFVVCCTALDSHCRFNRR